MPTYAVTLAHAAAWDDTRGIRAQDGWDAHAAFMDGLVDDGLVVVGGALGDQPRTLHLMEATGPEEIRSRLAQDPWAVAGLLIVEQIEPWALWLDGR